MEAILQAICRDSDLCKRYVHVLQEQDIFSLDDLEGIDVEALLAFGFKERHAKTFRKKCGGVLLKISLRTSGSVIGCIRTRQGTRIKDLRELIRGDEIPVGDEYRFSIEDGVEMTAAQEANWDVSVLTKGNPSGKIVLITGCEADYPIQSSVASADAKEQQQQEEIEYFPSLEPPPGFSGNSFPAYKTGESQDETFDYLDQNYEEDFPEDSIQPAEDHPFSPKFTAWPPPRNDPFYEEENVAMVEENASEEDEREVEEDLSKQLSQDLWIGIGPRKEQIERESDFPLPRRAFPPAERESDFPLPRRAFPPADRSSTKSKTQLYFAHFHPSTTPMKLQQLAEQFGEVLGIQFHTKGPTPFAFVAYKNADDAQKAAQTLNGCPVEEHVLRVLFADRHSASLDEQRLSLGSKARLRVSSPPSPPSLPSLPSPPSPPPTASNPSQSQAAFVRLPMATSHIRIEDFSSLDLLKIENLLNRYGRVVDKVRMNDDALVVEYEDAMQASLAVSNLGGMQVSGSVLNVCQIKEDHSSEIKMQRPIGSQSWAKTAAYIQRPEEKLLSRIKHLVDDLLRGADIDLMEPKLLTAVSDDSSLKILCSNLIDEALKKPEDVARLSAQLGKFKFQYNSGEKGSFRRCLLTQCQSLFCKLKGSVTSVDSLDDTAGNLESLRLQFFLKFLGHMYICEFIFGSVVNDCIGQLLNSKHSLCLLTLCDFVKIVGPKIWRAEKDQAAKFKTSLQTMNRMAGENYLFLTKKRLREVSSAFLVERRR
eukprot:m.3951 g.3951  ORF g.3951 m.3951 type:complete len:764 (+) comp10013_c0_seq1:170-2461(+)